MSIRNSVFVVLISLGLVLAPSSVSAQTIVLQDVAISINLNTPWNPTGISLNQGDVVIAYAKGLYKPNSGSHPGNWYHWIGPHGGYESAHNGFLVPEQCQFALVGKIGESGEPFWVGEMRAFMADETGTLYLGINDDNYGDNQGELDVYLWVLPGTAGIEDGPRYLDIEELSTSPNPSFGRCDVAFSLSEPVEVVAEVCDLNGRRIATICEGPRTAGEHRIAWDARDDSGQLVAAGTYFVRVRAGDSQLVQKTVLIR